MYSPTHNKMKQRIIYCLLTLFGLASCTDELPFEKTNPGEGDSNVTLSMSFHPETNVDLGQTRATKGDTIKDIKNLFIILYDQSGNDTGLHYYIENPETTEVPRDEYCPADTFPTTERQTVQAKYQCRIPYGTYRIYAVANMGNLAVNEYSGQIKKEADFKQIRFKWNTDIPQNAQMSGYFTIGGKEYERDAAGDYRREANELTIDKDVTSLHAWLRRAVSKVTVAYDATQLREGIYIYLKSVSLKNIPASCSLVDKNTPKGIDITVQGEKMKDLIFDGDKIVYETRAETQSDTAYILTKGHPHINGHKNIHDNKALAMFFYENMQGIGKEGTVTDKRQNVGNGNTIAYPDGVKETGEGWRDGKVNGTYVEVEAYYVSNAVNNVGRGRIIYRFMLGKDIITDYNAERNYHYKLTLKFNGNANDVDWHIDYVEEDAPGAYMPDYYVSYLYNQPYIDYQTGGDSYWEKCYPIRLAGKTFGDEITVRIIENNWYPTGETGDLETIDFFNKANYDAAPDDQKVATMRKAVYTHNNDAYDTRRPRLRAKIEHSGIWHGFLSLYQQEGEAEISRSYDTEGGVTRDWGRFSAGEYIYWYSRGQKPYKMGYNKNTTLGINYTDPIPEKKELNYGEGIRTYKTTLDGNQQIGEKIYEDNPYGAYKVVKRVKHGMNETTIYIPMYTRPLIINQKKGFTGNNPYFSFQRTATLQLTAMVNDSSITKTATVNQVRRVINPKGVFRSWNNDASFNVTLMYRTSERAGADFVKFPSEGGPWRATIVAGKGWNINGGTQVEGATNSTVSFTVKPNGKLANSTQTACALVRVEYHNYHCVHYIHLRQGYAPLSLDGGKTYWHSFNVRYTDGEQAYECDTELDGGSMFRYGNLTQPIDGINNIFEYRYTNTVWYNEKFVLAPIEETERDENQFASWSEITPAATFPRTEFTVDDVKCRLPNYNDLYDLKNNKSEIDFSLGLCYGDEANENSIDDERAFYYSWYARKGVPDWLAKIHKPDRTGKDPKGGSGVRGCFVYNHKTADVIFLSLGACSYGRRKGVAEDADGVSCPGILRYGDFDKAFGAATPNQGPYVPQLHDLYRNYGAIYWLGDKKSTASGIAVGWDINYAGIDFSPIYDVNLWHNSNGDYTQADAAYIRLVQTTKPTQAQCDKIHERMKAYQNGQ